MRVNLRSSKQMEPNSSSTGTDANVLVEFFNETAVYNVLSFLDPVDLHNLSLASKFIGKVVKSHINSGSWVLSFQSNNYDLTDDVVSKVANTFSDVKEANLKGCIKLTDAALAKFSESCQGIESLEIDGTVGFPIRHIGDGSGSSIAKFSQLKRLVLRRSMITDVGVEAFLSSATVCSSLTQLDLAGSSRIGDAALPLIAKCRNLAVLNLSGCARVTGDGLIQMLRTAAGTFLPTLKQLLLSRVQAVDNRVLQGMGEAIDLIPSSDQAESKQEGGLENRVADSMLLELLDFRGCRRVGDEGLRNVLSRCSKIQQLNVKGCLGISSVWNDPSIKGFASSVEFLDVSSVRFDSMSWYAFFSTSKQLKTLIMHETSIPTPTLDLLSECVGPQLELLDIGRISQSLDQPTEAALLRLARKTKRLKQLIVDGIQGFTARVCKLFLENNSSLSHLDVRGTGVSREEGGMVELLADEKDGRYTPNPFCSQIRRLCVDYEAAPKALLKTLLPTASLLIE